MSKIKNALIDIYGEDWSCRLQDIATERKERLCQKAS